MTLCNIDDCSVGHNVKKENMIKSLIDFLNGHEKWNKWMVDMNHKGKIMPKLFAACSYCGYPDITRTKRLIPF